MSKISKVPVGQRLFGSRQGPRPAPAIQYLTRRLSPDAAELLLTLSPNRSRFHLPTSRHRELLGLGLVEHSAMIAWRRSGRGQAVRAALGWEMAKWDGQPRSPSDL